VATILGAMNGMKIFRPELIEPFNNRIVGDKLGFMDLVKPVDENLDTLAARTCRIGLEILKANGATIKGDQIVIPIRRAIVQQAAESFNPNEFTKWWNPEWKLERAGFGAPGGGLRGIRGGTFLDEDVLATYPRDEVRGVKLYTKKVLEEKQHLTFEVAADPGRIWKLTVYGGNGKLMSKLIDGGTAIDWPDVSRDGYPQPLYEYEKSKELRKWETIVVDLSKYAGKETTIRIYQDILVRNGFPGNAYWRNFKFRTKGFQNE